MPATTRSKEPTKGYETSLLVEYRDKATAVTGSTKLKKLFKTEKLGNLTVVDKTKLERQYVFPDEHGFVAAQEYLHTNLKNFQIKKITNNRKR